MILRRCVCTACKRKKRLRQVPLSMDNRKGKERSDLTIILCKIRNDTSRDSGICFHFHMKNGALQIEDEEVIEGLSDVFFGSFFHFKILERPDSKRA